MASGIFTQRQVQRETIKGSWPNIKPTWVEYLVVAGGGGGGGSFGGGGGAGGLLQGIIPVINDTSYTITVGGGGTAGVYNAGSPTIGANGTYSAFSSITSTGGGAGGAYNGQSGLGGGSGGGSGSSSGTAIVGGKATQFGQGNNGGTGGVAVAVNAGAGGGGAGTVGQAGSGDTSNYGGNAGNGGAGITSSILGTVVPYAGGGGGGGYSGTSVPAGVGGAGGGGAGGYTAFGTATAGTTNTGGGGGGGDGAGIGGAGGSGCVVVRYPGTTQFYTGGSVYTIGGYVVHRFLSSGTLTPITPTAATAAPVIGESFAGGFYAGMIAANGSGFPTHYLITAPKSTGESTAYAWNTGGGSGGLGDLIDGPTNTAALNSATYPAAQWTRGLSIGGYTDWYLPAKNELQVCYYNLKPTLSTNTTGSGINPNSVPIRTTNYTTTDPPKTSATLFQAGQAQEFGEVNYWTSNGDPNVGNRATTISFYRGGIGGIYKASSGSNYRTRAFRRVAI